MIYVVFSGRLGNYLFQLAAAKSLDPDVRIVALTEDCLKSIKQYRETLFKGIEVATSIPNNIEIYREDLNYSYNTIPYDKNKDLIIRGFFQSHKYINRDIIQDYYKIPNDIRLTIENRYGDFFSNNEVVGIHVRRGDYLKLPHRHPFCGLQYYQNAIKYFGEDKKFIVCSDDIEWCKDNLKGSNFLFVENTSPLHDFFVQTYCHHNIISNSTFSWWAAYLNQNPNQKIIAPNQWYGIDLTGKDTTGLYTSNMISMDCFPSIRQRTFALALHYKDLIKKRITSK